MLKSNNNNNSTKIDLFKDRDKQRKVFLNENETGENGASENNDDGNELEFDIPDDSDQMTLDNSRRSDYFAQNSSSSQKTNQTQRIKGLMSRRGSTVTDSSALHLYSDQNRGSQRSSIVVNAPPQDPSDGKPCGGFFSFLCNR